MGHEKVVELESFRRGKNISFVLLTLTAATGLFFFTLTAPSILPEFTRQEAAQSTQPTIHFGMCHTGGGTNCVVDGDTFWMDGTKIRIADIDAPETHPSRCAREADLGSRATNRLHALLNAGPVELDTISRDEDVYGRKLRIVSRNGQSLGGMLVQEGLANAWNGSKQPWC